MKKSTLILAAFLCGAPVVLWSSEGLENIGASVAPISNPQAPAVLVAMSLPGMRSAAPRVVTLPQPVISDLTNYPNPFDSRKGGAEGQTIIAYQLVQDAPVSIEIFDLLGRKVRGWDIGAGASGGRQGLNSIPWDGTNGAGQKVSKGGYIAQIVIQTPETTVSVVRKIGVIH